RWTTPCTKNDREFENEDRACSLPKLSPTRASRHHHIAQSPDVHWHIGREQCVRGRERVAHRVRELLGIGAAGDRLDRAGATEIISHGASLEWPELDAAHIAEIVSERVHRIAGTGAVSEDVGIAVQLDAKLLEVAMQRP